MSHELFRKNIHMKKKILFHSFYNNLIILALAGIENNCNSTIPNRTLVKTLIHRIGLLAVGILIAVTSLAQTS